MCVCETGNTHVLLNSSLSSSSSSCQDSSIIRLPPLHCIRIFSFLRFHTINMLDSLSPSFHQNTCIQDRCQTTTLSQPIRDINLIQCVSINANFGLCVLVKCLYQFDSELRYSSIDHIAALDLGTESYAFLRSIKTLNEKNLGPVFR